MVENKICCGKQPFGKFCDECGRSTEPVEPTHEDQAITDPGTLVTQWNGLRVDLNEATEKFRGVAADMDSIASTLRTHYGIQLPSQVFETPPLTTPAREPDSSNAGALKANDVAPLVHPTEVARQPEEASAERAPNSRSAVLKGTKTGPMGAVGKSATAAEAPVGPSEAALEASTQRATTAQRPIGTIEDDHDGKVDPVVDQARVDSGTQSDKAPTDDPMAFQANVTRTLQRATQGKT